jgi:glycosyltransferase involved in cell wall biosynthesis
MKKALMIARAFPPFLPVGHSIRVVKFIKYLPALGWLPVVLTIDDKKEYETTRKMGSESLLSEIQPQVKIYRTTAGEPSLKYLSKESRFGRQNLITRVIVKFVAGARRWLLRNIFLPDRYLSWLPFALQQGRKIVWSEGVDVIFATCPPYSAVLIGATLKRLTGKPLVLDFRDDWIDTPWYYSRHTIRRMIERKLEGWAVKTADKVVLVTEWSRNAFLGRHPAEPNDKFVFIPNGCDLEEFAVLDSMPAAPHNSRFTIVHAGSLTEPKEWGRSPAGLFQAVQNILRQQPELAEKLTIVFAGDFPAGHQRLAEEMGVSRVIKGLGHLPHAQVLGLTKSADLLLAMNYEGWATLIPGKVYEYWAVGGPPILLLSCRGAAQELVEKHKLGIVVESDDVAGIERAVLHIYRQHEAGHPMRISSAGIEQYDRKEMSKKIGRVLSTVISC